MMQKQSAIYLATAVALVALTTLSVTEAYAQGKIVCWKDASGKVLGCGDKVPAEFNNSAVKELDKQGNVRKTGDSAETIAKRREEDKAQAATKAEEKKRADEQKRQDDALTNTFTNEKEIDLKRDRELQALNNFITQQNAALKVSNERYADVKKRADAFEKDKKPLTPSLKDDLARAERDKTRVEQEIATNEKAKADITTQYAAYRKRYMELKGIVAPAPAVPAPATTAATPAAAAPATPTAAAKK